MPLRKRLITRPRTVLPLPPMKSSPVALLAPAPFSSIWSVGGQDAQLAPGWVSPSIATPSLKYGNALLSAIVWTPAPGMAKPIVSSPLPAAQSPPLRSLLLLALTIASRNVH